MSAPQEPFVQFLLSQVKPKGTIPINMPRKLFTWFSFLQEKLQKNKNLVHLIGWILFYISNFWSNFRLNSYKRKERKNIDAGITELDLRNSTSPFKLSSQLANIHLHKVPTMVLLKPINHSIEDNSVTSPPLSPSQQAMPVGKEGEAPPPSLSQAIGLGLIVDG